MAPNVTRDRVVRAALELLDRGGLPGFSMRGLATELGVQQSALYWHVENKQTLLAAVADEILARIPGPAAGEWRPALLDYALAVRAELSAHPDGADVVQTALSFELGGDALPDAVAAALRAAGFDADDAEVAASVFCHFVLGAVLAEQQHDHARAVGAITERRDAAGRPSQRFSTDRFVRGVDVVLAGIRAQSSPASAPDRHRLDA